MSRSALLALVGMVALCVLLPVWLFMESFPMSGQYYVYANLPNRCKVVGEDNKLGSEDIFFATPGTAKVEIDCDGKRHEINLTVLSRGMQSFDWQPGEVDVECYVNSE